MQIARTLALTDVVLVVLNAVLVDVMQLVHTSVRRVTEVALVHVRNVTVIVHHSAKLIVSKLVPWFVLTAQVDALEPAPLTVNIDVVMVVRISV